MASRRSRFESTFGKGSAQQLEEIAAIHLADWSPGTRIASFAQALDVIIDFNCIAVEHYRRYHKLGISPQAFERYLTRYSPSHLAHWQFARGIHERKDDIP